MNSEAANPPEWAGGQSRPVGTEVMDGLSGYRLVVDWLFEPLRAFRRAWDHGLSERVIESLID